MKARFLLVIIAAALGMCILLHLSNQTYYQIQWYTPMPSPYAPEPPVMVIPEPEPEPEPERRPEPTPESTEILPPCKGLTNPGAVVYKADRGTMRVVGTLKDQYFKCDVLKKIENNAKTYYLVQINQMGFLDEYHVLDKSGVVLLEK